MIGKRALFSASLRLTHTLSHSPRLPPTVILNSVGITCRAYATESVQPFELSKLLPTNSSVTLDRDVVSRLFLSQGSDREARQYLKRYVAEDKLHFCIVKIGGGVLEGAQLRSLISSLEFLRKVGLFPIVVHGGGPQLNEELDKSGEVPTYIEGLRVTSPRVLSIAARVFERENTKLVDALEHAGMRARPVSRVFEAKPLNLDTWGLVGDVTRINTDTLASCILSGYIPVLTSLGQTPEGQLLNINADVAALELAKEIQPLKIIFLNTTGGMLDGDGKVIPRIRLEEEYDHLMTLPWVKHGTRLKIKEIKNCLDRLPAASSVSLTSPEHLASELFEPKGLGTHISRGERVLKHTNLDNVDLEKVRTLIEESFERNLVPGFFEDLRARLHTLYVTGTYEGVAILTKEKGAEGVPYLDKFAVSAKVRGQGVKELLWGHIHKDNPSLFWRSRVNNKINPWYFSHADGHSRNSDWTVFWYGLGPEVSTSVIERLKTVAFSLPATLNGVKGGSGSGSGSGSSAAKINVVAAPPQGYRVGLLGARGHTGSHLIHLLSQHSRAKLVCATSSTTPGQPVRNVCPTAPEGLNFIDISADSIAKTTQDLAVDAWFLALHDNAAKPYVEALSRGVNPPVLIDLSSDHRFDPSWVYGQPEAGNRDKIRGAKKIANPGCYATGMYCTIAPLVKAKLLDGPVHFFGVSGYSGAGTKPSPKNDVKRLADNLMPYTLINHMHEREVTHQLGHPVHFTPHVGQWFQGITLTGMLKLSRALTKEELEAKYKEFYGGETLVKITQEIPEVKDAAKKHQLTIGGLEVDTRARRAVTVTTLDNLLKGAATQAIQNLNLALKLEDEYEGIRKEL